MGKVVSMQSDPIRLKKTVPGNRGVDFARCGLCGFGIDVLSVRATRDVRCIFPRPFARRSTHSIRRKLRLPSELSMGKRSRVYNSHGRAAPR